MLLNSNELSNVERTMPAKTLTETMETIERENEPRCSPCVKPPKHLSLTQAAVQSTTLSCEFSVNVFAAFSYIPLLQPLILGPREASDKGKEGRKIVRTTFELKRKYRQI